jgi:glycosidase
MPSSIRSREVLAAFERARVRRTRRVLLDDCPVDIPTPFPSPADWRDCWIYSLLVDRFNNPQAPPRSLRWDSAQGDFQGGTLDGVREQLPYLQELGVGAILISPVQKNCQYDPRAYHGYGPQSFLDVEPRFASDPAAARRDPSLVERELRGLIDEAHARGMFVILDVVLNHAGNVFEYADAGSMAPWRDYPYPIRWRDELGRPRPDWPEAPANAHPDAAIQPVELRHNSCFLRQGQAHKAGDFYTYRKLDTRSSIVRHILVQVHKYLIAQYDLDGFRIDALDHLDDEFFRMFAHEIREYSLSIGKKNFFTLGEAYVDDPQITRFLDRKAAEPGALTGVEAMLDYPLFFVLPDVVKGFAPPSDLARLFDRRKQLHRGIVGSRGEPGRFFPTFLENHDQAHRFYYSPPGNPYQFDDQVSLGLGCLFCLPGIPYLYYGSEQGLCSTQERYRLGGARPWGDWVRESLWGKPNPFDRGHRFYRVIRSLSAIRNRQPALRYGRIDFRPVSTNGVDFGHARCPQGVLAFSRILNESEVVCVANTSTQSGWRGHVIVDARNPVGSTFELLFSNREGPTTPQPVAHQALGDLVIREGDSAMADGPARAIVVQLQSLEVQILARIG